MTVNEALKLNTPAETSTLIDKSTIASHFGRSASTYSSGAALQRKVGEHLLSLLPGHGLERLLDLGTGPGHFSAALDARCHTMVGLDIAPQMLAFARDANQLPDAQWITGDAEQLPLLSESIDGIFSSLMLQWSHSLTQSLSEARRVLKPGASLYFSTLLDGTLGELKKAWRSVDNGSHVNEFLTQAELSQAIQGAGFTGGELSFDAQTLWYRDVIALMRDLKAIGANTTNNSRRGLMGKQQLRALQQGYQAFRTEQGLPATYQVVYGVLTKDG